MSGMSILDQVFSLQGKTALITGGGTGLGKEFALTLSAAGANVLLAVSAQKGTGPYAASW